MSREIPSESSSSGTVYRISSARRRTLTLGYGLTPLLGGGMVVLLFLPQLPWSHVPSAFKAYAVLILLLVAARSLLLYLDRLRLHLIISPEGISYIGIGYRIYTPWDNVAGSTVLTVETEWRGSRRQMTGLALHSQAPTISVQFWARRLSGWRDASPTFIPLSDFAGYGGDLSREIQSYMPAFGVP